MCCYLGTERVPVNPCCLACTQNFEKFLVDKEGNVVGRYSSMASPESIANDIEKLL